MLLVAQPCHADIKRRRFSLLFPSPGVDDQDELSVALTLSARLGSIGVSSESKEFIGGVNRAVIEGLRLRSPFYASIYSSSQAIAILAFAVRRLRHTGIYASYAVCSDV